MTEQGWGPCHEAPWTEGVLELLNDISESEEVREELLEDELLLRPCLDCLASRSQAVVEGAMELLATLSEEVEGESRREEQCTSLVNVVRDASSVGFLMEYLNGPNMVLRRCAADCLANITSLPHLAQLVCPYDPDVRHKPQNLASLIARVADSSESPEVRQLSCQALANVLHSQASVTVDSDSVKKLVSCLPKNNSETNEGELGVLCLLALSYTFPFRPAVVDALLSADVMEHIVALAQPKQQGGLWEVGRKDCSWGGDSGAYAAAAALLGLVRQQKRKLQVHQSIQRCGGIKILAESFQYLVKSHPLGQIGLQGMVAQVFVQVFAECCLDCDDESHRRMNFPALSVASLLPFTLAEVPLVSTASTYILSSAYRSAPPAMFREAKEQADVAQYSSTLFELWTGSKVRSNSAREKAFTAYKGHVRKCMEGSMKQVLERKVIGEEYFPRVVSRKDVCLHLFWGEVHSGSKSKEPKNPKKESVAAKRRVTIVSDTRASAKESVKRLADTTRRKTMAAGAFRSRQSSTTINGKAAQKNGRKSTLKPTNGPDDQTPNIDREGKGNPMTELRLRLARLEKENKDFEASSKLLRDRISFLEDLNANHESASKIFSKQQASLEKNIETLKKENSFLKVSVSKGRENNEPGKEKNDAINVNRASLLAAQKADAGSLEDAALAGKAMENRILHDLQAEQGEIEHLMDVQLRLSHQDVKKLLKKRCTELMCGWAGAMGRLAEKFAVIEALIIQK